MGGPSVKIGSSAKLCILIFKASLLNFPGSLSAKVCSSARFGVVVFKACILNSDGGPSAKVCFFCQVLCTGIQGIYALF